MSVIKLIIAATVINIVSKNKGQGIVESVFSIGLLALILTGVVILVSLSLASKKDGFDRKKANQLAQIVLERQIAQSRTEPVTFWQFNSVSNQTESGFDLYTYGIGFTNIFNNAQYPTCGVGRTNCAEVVVRVDWLGKNPKSMYFNRFFSIYD